MRQLVPAVCLLLIATVLAGCGSKKVTITGTVTRGGEKMTWPDGGALLVIYMPEDESRDDRYTAHETDLATSTYKIVGIPPGRYKVAVQQFDPKYMDALGGKYDPGHTDLVKEVTEDGQVIDIDVPAAAGGGGGNGKGAGRKGKGGDKKDSDPKEPGKDDK